MRGETPNGDEGMWVVKSDSQRLASGGEDLDNVAGHRGPARFPDLVAEDPRVPRLDAPLFIAAEDNLTGKVLSVRDHVQRYQVGVGTASEPR